MHRHNFVSLLFSLFVIYLVTASGATITANINYIHVLNSTNFKTWKGNISIVLECIDLDLELRKKQPTLLTIESFSKDKKDHERRKCFNRIL